MQVWSYAEKMRITDTRVTVDAGKIYTCAVALTLIALFLVPASYAADPLKPIVIVDERLPLTERDGITLRNPYQLPLSEISTQAKPYQVDPFNAVIDIDFESSITVGQAMSRVLGFIGYDLFVSGTAIDPSAQTLFKRPLPFVHREFDRTRVKDVLSALVGNRYTVVVDHNIRAVTADYSPAKRRYTTVEEQIKP